MSSTTPAAIGTQPSNDTPAGLNYHGTSLEPFWYPESIKELAPNEENSIFNSRAHRRRYTMLRTALQHALQTTSTRHAHEKEVAPESWDRQLQQAASDFHSELSRRIGWDTTSLGVDPERRQHDELVDISNSQNMQGFKILDAVSEQAADSKFPSINTFIEHYPRHSIASAVQDFYKRQEERLEEYHALQNLKHLWERGELHYIFHRAVVQLRRLFSPPKPQPAGKGLSWYKVLTGDPSALALEYAPRLYQSETPEEAEMGKPVGDEKRRDQQLEALKKIGAYLQNEGIGFPSRLCPGNVSMMEFFQPEYTFPGPPWTDEAAKTLFDSNLNIQEQNEKWKDPEWQQFVRRETQKLLDSDNFGEYYGNFKPDGKGKHANIPAKKKRAEIEEQQGQLKTSEERPELPEPTASELLQTAESVNMQNDDITVEKPRHGHHKHRHHGHISMLGNDQEAQPGPSEPKPHRHHHSTSREAAPDLPRQHSAPVTIVPERPTMVKRKTSWLDSNFNNPKGGWPMGLRA